MEYGIGLGSNEGDRRSHLEAAVEFLGGLAEGGEVECSSWWESEPVDCVPGSGNFLNGVVILRSTCEPHDLLDETRAFEHSRGRASVYKRNSPRPLDLDILFLDSRVIDTERLQVPHPRLAERRFVLLPLSELRPYWVLPGSGETVTELLQRLPEQGVCKFGK